MAKHSTIIICVLFGAGQVAHRVLDPLPKAMLIREVRVNQKSKVVGQKTKTS